MCRRQPKTGGHERDLRNGYLRRLNQQFPVPLGAEFGDDAPPLVLRRQLDRHEKREVALLDARSAQP